MKLCFLITLFFILLLFKVTEAKIKHKWRITLYLGKTNWNTGAEYCVSTGGRLIRLDKVRNNVLAEYKQGIWDGNWDKEFLMGLHIIEGEFKWQGSNCSEAADISTWSNWKTYDPTKVCSTAESDLYVWKPKDCDHQHRLICEYNLGSCTFDKITNTDGMSSCTYNMNATPSVNMTIDDCKRKCRSWTYNGKECWAITFDPVSGNCYGSFGIDPFRFRDSTPCSAVVLNGTAMYHRNCFEGTLGGSVPALKYNSDIYVVESVLCAELTTSSNIHTTDSLITTEPTTVAADTTTVAADTTTDAADTTTDAADTTTVAADTTTDAADTTTVATDTTTVATDTTTAAADTTTCMSDTTPIDVANTTTATLSTNVSDSGCFCVCKNSTMTFDEKLEFLKFLKIDKDTTTKSKLKLQCAYDPRASAEYIGVVGLAVLSIVFGLMILSDCIALLSYMHKRKQTNRKTP